MNLDGLKLILLNGISINTSGSTGDPKKILNT